MWQTGIFDSSEWQAKWIGESDEKTENSLICPLFRKDFNLTKEVESATAIITAHGLYEVYINGKKIGNAFFTPGWTSYHKRLQYQVYDVTDLLQKGQNAVGAMLGSGWYSGPLAWGDNKYGKDLALLLQVQIKYTDGTSEVVMTDESWKSSKSNVLRSQIYNGETFDATKEKSGWKNADYDAKDWSFAEVKDFDNSNLIATYNEPIRKHEVFKPKDIITTPEGDTVIDFGQNLVGFVMMKARGEKGDTIILEHAEVLDKKGNFYTENLRKAEQKNIYILNGLETEYEPHFTWQGFRYVRVKGIKGEVNPTNFKAVALYSDMPETGTFQSSSEKLNQLQHNIKWGQKGNFLDVPTDCPQRDERLGWTGDAQVFFSTAAYNMQVDNFFNKWLKDLSADQFNDGRIPHVIPNVMGNGGGSAGWSDAATIIPWNMYLNYGDKEILADQYESMKKWVGYMEKESTNYLWNTGSHYGDWLFYRPDDDNDGRSAITDKQLIAQCFYAHSVQILINTAEILGKRQEVQRYSTLLQKIKEAFLNEYVTPNGRLVSSSQTAYVLALNFEMLPENLRKQAAQRLVDNIKNYNYHLTTGFLGTPYLCHVLTKFGHHDLAYTLLMQQTYPSWLYPVTMGATTIWERWDGRKPDGSFQVPTMNSFNHYAYGAIGDWMYKELGGIKTSSEEDGVGYKRILIEPHFENDYVSEEVSRMNGGEKLSEINSSHVTYYGTIRSHWKVENDKIIFKVSIPVNTTARIIISSNQDDKISEGGKPLSEIEDLEILDKNEEGTVVMVGSGNYQFMIE